MNAYVIAHLRNVDMGPAIVEYIERIDATLAPFQGRFLIHGGEMDVLEGAWSGDLIVVEFPSVEQARDWYASPAYRRILGLRADNSEGAVVIARGVPADHRATDILSA